MTEKRSPKDVLRRVRGMMAAGQLGEELMRQRGVVGTPLMVSQPRGGPHSWLVPVTIKHHMVGYLQLDCNLLLIRQVSFRRRSDSFEGVPDAADWLDPDRVLRRAAEFAMPNEDLGKPVLTYDRFPDRLAWRIKARSPAGTIRNIMVAGRSAWEQDDPEDTDEGPRARVGE